MSIEALITDRSRRVDWSGIRAVSALARERPGAVNLSIGQPEFAIPEACKRAAISAIEHDQNGYTPNPGLESLRGALSQRLARETGWGFDGAGAEAGLMITSGTSGGLLLACMAVLGPGDEVIVPDPYFVMYPHLATMCDARAVTCSTYETGFRLTAASVERLITPRTKMVILNSPGNPTGVVATSGDCAELLELCRRKNILLVSDEIYDEFTFSQGRTERTADGPRCPSPARIAGSVGNVLLIRGFGKTFGFTGWRLGYAAGPKRLIEELNKLQQYTFVCAPTPLQHGALAALNVDMSGVVAMYERRRDLVMSTLGAVAEVVRPDGAYYAFVKVPERLGMSGEAFFRAAAERDVLVIPGSTFSGRDTHFRLSFAVRDEALDRGLGVLAKMLRGQ